MYAPTPPDQNRHILSMMGIVLWAKKYQKIKTLNTPPCRLTAHERIEHLIVPSRQTRPQGQDLQGQDLQGQDLQGQDLQGQDLQGQDLQGQDLQGQDLQGQTNVQSNDFENIKTVPFTTNVKYHLQGVHYDHWTLIVDMAHLDPSTQEIWHSLCQSLAVEAQKTVKTYRTNEIYYPMVENDYRSQGVDVAQEVFLGFVFGLSLSAMPQVALLSPINEHINHTATHTLPSLTQMSQNANLKKQLWQTLTAPNS